MRGLEEIVERNTEATRNAVLRSALEHCWARAAYATANPHVQSEIVREICETCYGALEDLDDGD